MNFGRVVQVKIIKILRGRFDWFRLVEVKLGNSKDYSTNPVIYLMTPSQDKEDFSIITVQPTSEEAQNWQGQYMQLIDTENKFKYFGFYEIQVIEWP